LLEEAAFVVRVNGKKDGRQVDIESYVNAPGLTESFRLAQMSHESYYTGQSASLFTKMLVNGVVTRSGVFPPEMLETEERSYFLREAEKLKITVDRTVTTRLF
jgi:saccharopine dehydrogenase (NAD+, L-lysine forming)